MAGKFNAGSILAVLAILAGIAYAPALSQPLLEDDYPNLAVSRDLGAPQHWQRLATSVFRNRATSAWLMSAAYGLFGVHAAPYYAINILLHILNTWLVFALGRWPAIGFHTSAMAAAAFALLENHQEAIMWFSACNELLQFLFGISAFVCWLNFLFRSRKPYWYAAALGSFLLALLSKESAVILAPLFLLPLLTQPKRQWLAAVPFVALAAASAGSVYALNATSFRVTDGSFSLHAPFWRTWPENFARLFWFWGLLGLWAVRKNWQTMKLGILWAAIALLPYSFLLYSPRIPSRQFYLPSLGVALVIAAGLQSLPKRLPKPVIALLCAVFLTQNIAYLWTRKRHQFLERARPTEQLIALARSTTLPIYVKCFPQPHLVAEDAVRLAARPEPDLIWDEQTARTRGPHVNFCYARR